MNVRKLVNTWRTMRMTYGLFFIVIGLDKFTNLATLWEKYVSLTLTKQLPLDLSQVMMGAAGIEILLGVIILFLSPRIGGYLGMLWLLLVSVNVFMTGLYFDVAIYNFVIAIGALTLARLTSLKNEAIQGV